MAHCVARGVTCAKNGITMTAPIDELYQACCSGEPKAVRQILADNAFTDVELERMVQVASSSPELLQILLARVTPSEALRFQLFHSGAAQNVDIFSQLMGLQPTPEEIGQVLDACQSSFITRVISYDEKGNETISFTTLSDAEKARLSRVFELGLAAHGKPNNIVTLLGGLVEIGRTDLADQLAANTPDPDLSEVAFFGFRDRSKSVQQYVSARANMRGNVGRGALCGALSDGNETLARELLSLGANPAEPYKTGFGAAVLPLESLGRTLDAPIVRILIEAGASVTSQAVARAVTNRNAAVLDVLLNAGGTDDGSALLSAITTKQPDMIARLRLSQIYLPNTLLTALRMAREARHSETTVAVEAAFTSQLIEIPPVPPAWRVTFDIATASLPALWAEWMRYRKERLFADETANPPATSAEFTQLTSTVGLELPSDVMWLYQQHNGECANVPFGRGMMFGERFLSLAEATQSLLGWQSVRESIADTPNEQAGAFATPQETVKCQYINAKWIALSDTNGNNISVDLDPGPKGVSGQIIYSGRDVANKVQLGTSFTEFARAVLRQIVANNVEVLESSGFVMGEDRYMVVDAAAKLVTKGTW
jgi:cell wall assembly regulator SMI1